MMIDDASSQWAKMYEFANRNCEEKFKYEVLIRKMTVSVVVHEIRPINRTLNKTLFVFLMKILSGAEVASRVWSVFDGDSWHARSEFIGGVPSFFASKLRVSHDAILHVSALMMQSYTSRCNRDMIKIYVYILYTNDLWCGTACRLSQCI